MANGNRKQGNIIIRREEVIEGGHHGGAWKVAYADFVTAMMAFFLLMWLLNATTEEQRRGLADYFSPMNIFGRSLSGSGQPFGGQTPNDQGTAVSQLGQPDIVPGPQQVQLDVEADDSDTTAEPQEFRDGGIDAEPHPQGGPRADPQPAAGTSTADETQGGDYAREAVLPPDHPGADRTITARTATAQADASDAQSAAAARQARREREAQAFSEAAEAIRHDLQADPRLAELGQQIVIDTTPEGLRIQIIDEEKQPMFALGASVPNERARLLVSKIGPVLARLENQVSIAGHTDAAPFRGSERTNWELSAERANAMRRVLVESGLGETRIRSVTGNADRDLLLPDQPMAAANRRIAIVVLRQELMTP